MKYQFSLSDGRNFVLSCDDLLSVNDVNKLVSILWPGSILKTCTRIK